MVCANVYLTQTDIILLYANPIFYDIIDKENMEKGRDTYRKKIFNAFGERVSQH